MTDIQLYDTVAELLTREERKDPGTDVGELRAERTRLLDELRPYATEPGRDSKSDRCS